MGVKDEGQQLGSGVDWTSHPPDAQERQWAEHVKKARAQGRCEFSGLQVHSCHRSVCDCFAAWGCQWCNEPRPCLP